MSGMFRTRDVTWDVGWSEFARNLAERLGVRSFKTAFSWERDRQEVFDQDGTLLGYQRRDGTWVFPKTSPLRDLEAPDASEDVLP